MLASTCLYSLCVSLISVWTTLLRVWYDVEVFLMRCCIQTHDDREHLAMMERILGSLPYRMTKRSKYALNFSAPIHLVSVVTLPIVTAWTETITFIPVYTVLSLTVVMAALRSRCGHYIFALWFLSSFFYSSPNLSRRRLDVCHTSTHGVALVQI